jgi:hypothetical protein
LRCLALWFTGWLCLARAVAATGPVEYYRDVRPILADKCFACHGPDETHRMANLRLDTGGGLAQSIVAGDPSASRLYQRIASPDKLRQMPPPASGGILSEAQKDTIRRWIEGGGKSGAHWAYAAPIRPELPDVANRHWPRNPIDYFILNRLEREGLKPSPEADKITLLRRVSFDLTGLPPTPEESRRFLDDSSPNAYESLVGRLLDSPHFGERMAMEWLDVARYADTHGYQIDSAREMWPWRDWVVNAFNRNMPFDRFTIEQLAGDLLPNATEDQRIATGFNRNHMINSEGGSIAEEFQAEYVADRVETTAAVWLGTTLGCARCHDHKYDPISQRDFYRFSAYFNHVPEKGLHNAIGNAEPVLQLGSADQHRELDRLNAGLAERDPKIAEAAVTPLIAAWEKTDLTALPSASRSGLLAHYEFDGSLSDLSGNSRQARVLRGEIAYDEGPVNRAATLNGVTHIQTGVDLPDAFSIALWTKSVGLTQMTVLQNTEEPVARRGFEMLFDDSRPLPGQDRGVHITFRLVSAWPNDRIEIRTRERVSQEDWTHITFAYSGSGKASGISVFLNGRPLECTVVRDALSGSAISRRPLEIGNSELGVPFQGQLDDLRVYKRPLTQEEARILAEEEPLRAALSQPAAGRSKEQGETLRRYFLTHVLTHGAPEDLRRAYSEYQSMLAQRDALLRSMPTVMVMQEMQPARDTFLLAHGDYRSKMEKVTPGVPAALSPLPVTAPPDRLGLARWLVDSSNPLTARVIVNRYWQMYFGTGLVKTAEDFGSQGEPPSHPELLDWLATEFVRTGWDVKSMQRLIVTSAAYRQSSASTPALLERDPENRLLARASRFRLPAESIRDNALAASGLLDEKIGGPSVFPYQPDGLWEELTTGAEYTAQVYSQSHGRDLYRRSMYTFWKRAVPPPALTVFDAPDRDKCTVRRMMTNTPMQALVLMNDPSYVEAARALAERALRQAAKSPDERAALVFRLAASRDPSESERLVLVDLAARNVARYRREPEEARKLLAVGESKADGRMDAAELAGWTIVASVVLNLDETITKE